MSRSTVALVLAGANSAGLLGVLILLGILNLWPRRASGRHRKVKG